MKTRRYFLLPLSLSFALGIVLAVATFALAGVPADSSERQLHAGTLADALGVFHKAGNANVPIQVGLRAEHLFSPEDAKVVPEELSPGALRLGQGRRLLVGVGSRERTLYAWPTTKGAVCVLVAGEVGTCDDRVTEKVPVVAVQGDPDALGSGQPGLVAGLVTDDVVRVDVRVGGVVSRARLANNGFLYELGTQDRLADAIVAGYRDGVTRTLALPIPLPAN